MNIAIELRAVEATPKRFFQYLRDESAHPSGEFSGKSKEVEQSRLGSFLAECLVFPKACLIHRRWAYNTQQTTEFVIRPSPEHLSDKLANSSLALVCQMNDDGTLEVIDAESRSGPFDPNFEACYNGKLEPVMNSFIYVRAQTDQEGRRFLDNLPEVGVDLNKPLAAWTTYLDWRQKLAERKANESYAYSEFKIVGGRSNIDFYLTKPDVRELLKTRLSGETVRVFATDSTPSPEADENIELMDKKPPIKAAFEGEFRSIRSVGEENSIRGKGRYNLRHVGKPKGDAETLIVRLVIDPCDEQKSSSVSDIPDSGVIKAAMEGELKAVDVQRNGLRRLSEFQGLNPNIRRWLFNPVEAKPITGEPKDFLPDSQLNEEQMECVKKALILEDLLLLWGPPGTGKTTVIAEIASQYCRLGLRVLISSQANLAVDQALERLPKLAHIRPARLSTSKNKNKLGIDIRSGMLWWLKAVAIQIEKDLKTESDPRWHQLMKGWQDHLRKKVEFTDLSEPCTRHYKTFANVIGATCLETGKPDFYNGKEFNAKFDLSIVDEVSKATPPELLLPALIGRRTILVGDHRQLPPVFRESTFPEAIENDELTEEEFDRFEGMVTSSLFEQLFDRCDPSIRIGLRQQYRMHPQIMAAVNRFYADQPLSAGGGHEQLTKAKTHSFSLLLADGTPWLKPGQHLVWIDSTFDADGNPVKDEKIGTSRHNEAEARVGVELLRALLPKTDSIGLISLYRAQIQKIETLLKNEDDSLLREFLNNKGVNTVDQFQGSEREVIIVSLTRTDPHLTGEFIKDFRRINVAISRAKKLLIIIGRRETFDSGIVEVPSETGNGIEARPVYKEIREIAQKTGLHIGLHALMTRSHDNQKAQDSVVQHKQHGQPCINEPKTLYTAFEGLHQHFPTLNQKRPR
jgi:hypothetical protein